MSQTSSPTLLYDGVGSVNEGTTGGDRENFIAKLPSNGRKTLAVSPERFRAGHFTQLLLHLMSHMNAQGMSLEKLLSRLSLESTSYANTISIRPVYLPSGGTSEIPPYRFGVDVSSLVEKPESKSLQLSAFEIIQWLRTITGLSQDRIARLIGVTRQTLHNWEKGEPISDHNRQRLLQVKDVLERAASQHSTPASLVTWLDTPRGAEGYTPFELVERNEIGKARLFAISSPSPRLKRPPSWIRRSVPEAFKSGEEHYDEALPPEYGGDSVMLADSEVVEELANSQGEVKHDGGNSTVL